MKANQIMKGKDQEVGRNNINNNNNNNNNNYYYYYYYYYFKPFPTSKCLFFLKAKVQSKHL